MVMMMSWLWIMQCIIWGGDKRVRVTAPVKATAKNEVSTHSGVQTFTTRSKKNKQASRELCNILYKKNIFFVTWTIVCCSWTCSGVSFDTYACTWSVPFWYFTIEEKIHWNFKEWLMCLSSVSRCIFHDFHILRQNNRVGSMSCGGIILWMLGGFSVMMILGDAEIFKKRKPFVDATILLVTRWFDLSELEDQSCSGY